jgi:hypothetical protein
MNIEEENEDEDEEDKAGGFQFATFSPRRF